MPRDHRPALARRLAVTALTALCLCACGSDSSSSPDAATADGHRADATSTAPCGPATAATLSLGTYDAAPPQPRADGDPFVLVHGRQGLWMIGFDLVAAGVPERCDRVTAEATLVDDDTLLSEVLARRQTFTCAGDLRVLSQFFLILPASTDPDTLVGRTIRLAVQADFPATADAPPARLTVSGVGPLRRGPPQE